MHQHISKISSIALVGNKREKQESRERIALETYNASHKIERFAHLLELLRSMPISALDRKVKHGEDLSFEEAFCGMCYVLAATNNLFFQAVKSLFQSMYQGHFNAEKAIPIGAAFLNLMACKESMKHLTTEEVAGMAAAGYMDTVFEFALEERIIETCGMGGDKGFLSEGKRFKSINVSTLSSIVLSSLGIPCIKHGSYGNTSAVGSTDSLELFGANTSFNDHQHVADVYAKSGYCFFDAHLSKTLHDLSHLLMMETVNHVLGPFTPPVSSAVEINKVMGVNEKMDPETVAEAYALLHQKGLQKIGGVIVVAGLGPHSKLSMASNCNRRQEIRNLTVSDELSPYDTVLAVTYKGDYLGIDVVSIEDFGVHIEPSRILVSQHRDDIQAANASTLSGKYDPTGNHTALVDYLAANAALGLFSMNHLGKEGSYTISPGLKCVRLNRELLVQCFNICKEAIVSGRTLSTLEKYVEATGSKLVLANH